MNEAPDLIAMIKQAEATGAIPTPVLGESQQTYRMRVAHAGAVIGVAFCQQVSASGEDG